MGGDGADAVVGDERIFFLYISSASGVNPIELNVFDFCNGGFPVSNDTLGQIFLATQQDSWSTNGILKGNANSCDLPVIQGVFDANTARKPRTSKSADEDFDNGATPRSLFAWILLSLLASLSWNFLN